MQLPYDPDEQLPYDPDDPPIEPPTNASPLMWRLARGLWLDHQPGVDNWCLTCRAWYPCVQRQLADHGLLLTVLPHWVASLRPEVLPHRLGGSGTERGPLATPEQMGPWWGQPSGPQT